MLFWIVPPLPLWICLSLWLDLKLPPRKAFSLHLPLAASRPTLYTWLKSWYVAHGIGLWKKAKKGNLSPLHIILSLWSICHYAFVFNLTECFYFSETVSHKISEHICLVGQDVLDAGQVNKPNESLWILGVSVDEKGFIRADILLTLKKWNESKLWGFFV